MALVPFPSQAKREPEEPDGWLDDESETEHGESRMSFLEHLDELRKRLMYSVAALAVGVVISFTFISSVFDFIMRPLQQMLPPGSKLVYTEPTEAFVLYMKIAFLTGVIIATPFIMWQVWLFIAPGLYLKEKRFAIPFVLLSTGGFVLGAWFTHKALFPWMWMFLASFGASSDYLMFMPKIESVFSLYTKMVLGMGLVFQMPTIIFFLAKMGVVTAGFLLRNFKYAILIIFIVAAVITPTGDMLTQTLFAAPMIGLYLISIVIAWLVGKKSRRSAADRDNSANLR